jgi:hypothetical protein
MAKKYKNFEEARAAIIAHAWKNPEFKAKLLKNPRAAFKEMGVDLPKEIDVRIVEDKGNAFTFVLPRAVVNTSEFTEEQLRKMAGGACIKSGVGTVEAVAQSAGLNNLGEEARAYCRRMIASSGPG